MCPLGTPGERNGFHCEHASMWRLSAALSGGDLTKIVNAALDRQGWLITRMIENGVPKEEVDGND